MSQRELETHVWLAGYMAGTAGKDLDNNPIFETIVAALRKGWERGHELHLELSNKGDK